VSEEVVDHERVARLENRVAELEAFLNVEPQPPDPLAEATARFRAANVAKRRAGVKPPGRSMSHG
jgi:hypothetical protein